MPSVSSRPPSAPLPDLRSPGSARGSDRRRALGARPPDSHGAGGEIPELRGPSTAALAPSVAHAARNRRNAAQHGPEPSFPAARHPSRRRSSELPHGERAVNGGETGRSRAAPTAKGPRSVPPGPRSGTFRRFPRRNGVQVFHVQRIARSYVQRGIGSRVSRGTMRGFCSDRARGRQKSARKARLCGRFCQPSRVLRDPRSRPGSVR